jgi:hypothetical protein
VVTKDQLRLGNHRSEIGYVARSYRAQLLGFLIVNRDKTEIQKKFPPLRRASSLLPEEQYLLEGVHNQLVELYKQCTAPLVDILQQFAPAIDPYHRFNYRISENARDVKLFPESSINDLVEAYHQLPSLQIAMENYEEAKKVMTIDQLNNASIGLERRLLNASPLRFPNDLDNLTDMLSENAPVHKCFNFFCALMCIRVSLNIINELIYQAILTNKLPTFSEKNIIVYKSIMSHFGGTGIDLLCQPDVNIGDLDIGRLAFLKDPNLVIPADLCFVERIDMRISDEYGETMRVLLRLIDEDLNPYSRILKYNN